MNCVNNCKTKWAEKQNSASNFKQAMWSRQKLIELKFIESVKLECFGHWEPGLEKSSSEK